MSEGELRALLLAARALDSYTDTPMATEVRRIFNKLTDTLRDQLTVSPELIFSRFSFVSPPAKPVNETIWATIVTGLLSQHSVEIRYHSLNTGETSERTIDPYHVANLQGEWYVLAWCHKAKRLLQFGIPQIQKAGLTNNRFRLPKDFDVEKLLAGAFRRQVLGEEVYRVKLRFDKSVATCVTERQWHPRQKARTLRNGDIELTFPTVGLFEVSRWVLSWGQRAKVVTPSKLKKMIEDEIKMMAKEMRNRR